MRLEEELAGAMEAHVADVHAGPSMGAAVRRRHRARGIRSRTAGAALATAVVAGAVPAYLALDAGATVPSETAAPAPGLGAPSALWTEAPPAPPTATADPDTTADPDASPSEDGSPAMPQDLGDLGDGRRFGGVRFGYLPEGLKWGEWSVKNTFGTTSYSTTWVEPGLEPGMYSVQAVVYRDGAARQAAERMKGYRKQGSEAVVIGGERVHLVRAGEAVGKITEDGTPTALWTEAPGLAVEVMLSPDYAGRLGGKETERELRRIVEGLEPTG
ncbi:hypothetical protein Ppa06_12630 [Planomonospora parontospora subsp. parontospora]|uniref:Uncharacterized protein n=2 Tax=Planomonospora parontospora TaxID=58119 RepID=A0AA37F399_9ACTN|nr:hypothetical protein [Planomonospora parontospora]GGK54844.1 hypothetical protein GCM10010126_12950 [Planomonospora parontospora]GII07465.1 hypothetical protein Ppa06_12630 [Planomonospora parontospora subsp. parontospora]